VEEHKKELEIEKYDHYYAADFSTLDDVQNKSYLS